ncbi:5535_t:CDS:2, partial [Racocetra persica]
EALRQPLNSQAINSNQVYGRPPILDKSAHNRLTQLVLNNHRITKRDIQAALEQQEGK